jgi:hypothetical protein
MCSLGCGGALADFGLQENPTADVKFIPLDLGNLADVKRTADDIVNSEERLDIVGRRADSRERRSRVSAGHR